MRDASSRSVARLGIVSAYPDEDWHSRRICEAAARVAEAEVLSPLDFTAEVGAHGARLVVRGRPADEYDALLTPRALGEEGDHELQLELYRTLAEEGAVLVNDVGALTLAIDKWKTGWVLSRAGLPTPSAIVTQRLDVAVAALERWGGRAVRKPLFGSLGMGVELVAGGAARATLAQRLASCGAIYLQSFVDGGGRDLRAFVVGDRVEAAIARRAPAGEFRTNVHLGGIASPVRLPPSMERIAVLASRALGLDYAGVDLVETPAGPQILEVNGTPLFRGVLEATGLDMAVPIVAHALARADRGDRRRAGARSGVGLARTS
jgi:ribosomal protein S6--L-glutamate ligase